MTWQVWADDFSEADLTGTSKIFAFKATEGLFLRGMRTYVVFFNQPTVTELTGKIYTDSDPSGTHAAGVLKFTSTDTITKAEIATDDYALKEIYFTFDDVPIAADTFYTFTINASGYTYSTTSFLAWKRGWPNPVNNTGFTATSYNMILAPYQCHPYAAPHKKYKAISKI